VVETLFYMKYQHMKTRSKPRKTLESEREKRESNRIGKSKWTLWTGKEKERVLTFIHLLLSLSIFLILIPSKVKALLLFVQILLGITSADAPCLLYPIYDREQPLTIDFIVAAAVTLTSSVPHMEWECISLRTCFCFRITIIFDWIGGQRYCPTTIIPSTRPLKSSSPFQLAGFLN